MEAVALAVGCIALLISLASLSWQVHTWRQARRFDVRVTADTPGAGVGSRRYPLEITVANLGGTEEAIAELWLSDTDDSGKAEKARRFQDPQHIREPTAERGLPPNRRYCTTFNLLAAIIAGPGFPKAVIAWVRLESGRVVFAAPYYTKEFLRETAMEPAGPKYSLPEGVFDDYFASGPTVPCPDCKTMVPADANVCRYCEYRF
jgi:hypothetical protein